MRSSLRNAAVGRLGLVDHALVSRRFFRSALATDIARADTLFLVMVLGGILAVCAWAKADTGWRGHGRIAAAAAILSLILFFIGYLVIF